MTILPGLPVEGADENTIIERIRAGSRKSRRDPGGRLLGYPHTRPHPIGIEAFKAYLRYNTNHVGTLTRASQETTASRTIERELIRMMGAFYGDSSVDGYVTSGGTEGNVMGVWIARQFLRQSGYGEMVLFKTSLTHQSIDKACSLNSIACVRDVALNEDHAMDPQRLEEQIEHHIRAGYGRFLVIATAGYTTTGTADSIEAINGILERASSRKAIAHYLHVDAAIGGLVYPFCGQQKIDFRNACVRSMTVDPHKMGYVPLSAGLFLCRKDLQKHISIPIRYANGQVDDTLIGSRNGAAAVACWAVFSRLGQQGFRRIMDTLVRKKTFLLRRLMDRVTVVSDPGTNMVCLHFKNLPGGRLPDWLEKKYLLESFSLASQKRLLRCYKIYVMPHVTRSVLEEFATDVAASESAGPQAQPENPQTGSRRLP